MGQFDWTPEVYLERIRTEIPGYDELQEQSVAAIPFPPERVIELGMGTGETTRRLNQLDDDQKRNLGRQVKGQARSLVIGDVFAGNQLADLVEWCEGEITWQQGDLAVVRAAY